MDVGGAYSNTKTQVDALERLHRKLPDPAAPVPPPTERPRPGRARQLGADQVQELIAGYQHGETMYQLGANPTTVLTKLRQRGIPTRDAHGRPRA